MKRIKAVLMLVFLFTQQASSHDAEVTRLSICDKEPGVYFIEVNKVFYRTTVESKGSLILIDNPPMEAAGGLCYCRSQDSKPKILVCD
jgi:hypothetical protein